MRKMFLLWMINYEIRQKFLPTNISGAEKKGSKIGKCRV